MSQENTQGYIGSEGQTPDTNVSSSPGAPASVDATTTSSQKPAGGNVEEKYDPKKATGHVGLFNQGATCYLSSLIQTYFHIPYFREAVYMMGTEADDLSDIPKALQNLFFQMQERSSACSTKCLTDSFGWDEREVYVQHDIQELASKLRDNMEGKMKGTPSEGAIFRLFTGLGENIVQTLDNSYTSRRQQEFQEIQIPVTGYKSLQESLKSLVKKDKLTGDNKYKVEEEGKPAMFKEAEMGYNFLRFPPCLCFHLMRFEMDMMSPTLEMKKVNSQFDFPTTLDLREYEQASQLSADEKKKCSLVPINPKHCRDDQKVDDTTVSDAIYDLYGVIVHRGGVRSGHYYAFIRSYDVQKQDWDKWYCYDDDDVREVTETLAVDRNFGGTIYSYINGREIAMPATHSAYVVTYMRRSEAAKLIYPINTNSIPQLVKDEFARQLIEDENLQREEAEKAKSVTFTLITDQDIARHVNSNVFELAPRNDASNNTVSLKKTDKLIQLYEILKQRHFDVEDIRMWRWRYVFPNSVSGWRPGEEPIPLFKDCKGQSIEEVFQKHHQGEEGKPWAQNIYVEQRREVGVATITNATMFEVSTVSMTSKHTSLDENFDPNTAIKNPGVQLKFDPADGEPALTVSFKKPIKISQFFIRVHNSKSITPFDSKIRMQCFANLTDTTPVTYQDKIVRHSGNNLINVLYFNSSPTTAVQKVVFSRVAVSMRTVAAFSVSRVYAYCQPNELAAHQPAPPKTKVIPPYAESEQVLLFIKYFNHLSGIISYVGCAVCPRHDPIKNAFPIFRQMLRMAPDVNLMVYDETKPYPVVPVSEMHCCHSTEGNLVSGNILTVQMHPTQIPLVFRFVRADHFYSFFDNQRQVTLRRYGNTQDMGVVVNMQGGWRYDQIAECIGERVGVDPAYIRLYGSASFSNPTPKAEPERSDNFHSLEQMLRISQNWFTSDVFYEVLEIPLHEMEQCLQLKITLTAPKGEPLAPEVQFLIPIGSTASQIVKEVLKKTGMEAQLMEQYKGHFAFIEIGEHLIQKLFRVHLLPDGSAEEESVTCAGGLAQSPITLQRVNIHRLYEVRPYIPPTTEEHLFVCGHADNSLPHSNCFGGPWLMNVNDEENVEDALKHLMDWTGVPVEEVIDPQNFGAMMQTSALLNFPKWETPVIRYFEHTVNHSRHASHLMLNHKKPREKPGSRYVAMHEPTLDLEKKKKKTGSSPSPSPQSASSPALPLATAETLTTPSNK